MSAYVLDSDHATATDTTLEWLLCSIFPSSTLRAQVRERMREPLGGARSLLEARAAIIAFAQAEAARDTDFGRSILRAVEEHEARVRRNVHAYNPHRNTPESGFWPDPTDPKNTRSLYREYPTVEQYRFIDKQTKIVSAGSCFATEIARWLQLRGFNYLVAESDTPDDQSYNVPDGQDGVANASAAWGIIFNTPAFRQLVGYAFGEWERPEIVFNLSDRILMDPFRENVHFKTVEDYERNRPIHRSAARRVLTEAEVLIITLGLNEVWFFRPDGSAFSRNPWRSAPSLIEARVPSVAENVDELEELYRILKRHNPGVRLIVTLSPVALHATFQHDEMHIIEANTLSKATLRLAADEFCRRHDDVHYFPSYEMVMTCIQDPWDPDQRHVSRKAIDRVMQMFQHMFMKSGTDV